MLTLRLSSVVLQIPYDAYTTLSRNLIGYSTQQQADWLILENNEKATLNIDMPYCIAGMLLLVSVTYNGDFSHKF